MDLGGNLAPSKVAAAELPDGFTMGGDPSGNAAGESEQQQKAQQMEEQRRAILEQACTQEALARLGRIRMVRESKAKAIENSIVSMALQGKLPGKINEGKLIEILERGNFKEAGGAQDGQINIQRKRYAFDSDDDSDNDDDL
jgi:programmed cell death protein 5